MIHHPFEVGESGEILLCMGESRILVWSGEMAEGREFLSMAVRAYLQGKSEESEKSSGNG